MALYRRHMKQGATYWPPGTNDGFGGTSYGSPTLIMCRWQDKAVLFRDNEGREVTSDAVVYVDTEVKSKGKLFLGVSQASNPVVGAKEIRAVQQSPSLKADETLIKVML
jgi:hypothetical protein